MNKVFLIGSPHDITFRHTIRRFRAEHVPATVLNIDYILKSGELFWDSNSRELRIMTSKKNTVVIDGSCGVYLRAFDFHSHIFPAGQREVRRAKLTLLQLSVQSSQANVVPPPLSEGGNTSKPYQLHLLAKLGFLVPDTLVTNSPERVLKFVKRYNGDVVFKAISSVKSIAKKWDDTCYEKLDRLKLTPILLQQCISGPDVRLHLLGTCVSAERITSPELDYRFSEKSTRTFEPYIVSASTVDLARQFMQEQNLKFAGFDFKVCRKTGAHYCLEANPNPGYEGFDYRANFRISRALISELSTCGALSNTEQVNWAL